MNLLVMLVDRDSSVGIAARYWLNGLGIKPPGGNIFHARPASCTVGTGSFPGVKQPERGVDYPLLSGAEVANEM